MAMALLTQKVIKEAFWKLLSEKSFSKITVKDIVEICGINRNSFYYHFADIPSLARECVMDYIGAVVDHNDKASIEECQEAIFTSYQELSGKLCQMMEQFLKVVYLS